LLLAVVGRLRRLAAWLWLLACGSGTAEIVASMRAANKIAKITDLLFMFSSPVTKRNDCVSGE
jgi:hypothetical protein